jgi:hypothetical protein
MRAKKASDDDRKAATVVANDRDALKGALKSIGGSQSDDWNNILLDQTIRTLWLKHSDEDSRSRQYNATLATLVGIGPKDEIEGMIAAQLLAAYNVAMECYRRAVLGGGSQCLCRAATWRDKAINTLIDWRGNPVRHSLHSVLRSSNT